MNSRYNARAKFDESTRIALLEGDADQFQTNVENLQGTINRLVWSIVGATLSIATASIMLAVNLAVT